MVITRGLFLTLGSLMMVAIGYVWLYIEGPHKTTLVIFLALFFILLSVEYLREGFEQEKQRATTAISQHNKRTDLSRARIQATW